MADNGDTPMGAGASMENDTRNSSFIAKLLAPLPPREERADAPRFLRELQDDKTLPWRLGLEDVRAAKQAHTAALAEDRRHGLRLGDPAHFSIEAYRALRLALDRQCCIPAPGPAEVRWKARQGVQRMTAEAQVRYFKDCETHGVPFGQMTAPRKGA